MSTRASARGHEDGVVLLWFAMLAFPLFALAAVYVDLAVVRLTQQQMQVATETAALEGLRFRDFEGEGAAAETIRQRAVRRVAEQFDDDFNANPGDPVGFGAGPDLSVTGAGPLNAGGLIEIGAGGVWKPQGGLQLNEQNLRHGDFVAGSYDPAAISHIEAGDYTRTDFTAASVAEAGIAPAFLARLRRTNDTVLDRVPGVSSAGEPIPLLFGLGAAINGSPGGGYNPRTDGITVRATSIADSRRALAVSPAQLGGTTILVPGSGSPVPSFGLRVASSGEQWDSLAVETAITLELGADGVLRPSGSSEEWGAFAVPTESLLVVGSSFATAPAELQDVPPTELLVPVYRSLVCSGGEAGRTVIGFVLATMTVTVESGTPQVSLTRRAATVVPAGASALSITALQTLATCPELALARFDFAEPVLAPVLAR